MRKHPKAALAMVAMLAGGPVAAADLPSGKSLPMAPALPEFYSWTGVYVGLQGGYSWDTGRLRAFSTAGGVPAAVDRRHGAGTAVGGVQAGFNYQMGALVLGVEADIEALDAGSGGLMRVTRDWQGSVRGRIGYAFDHLMIYGSAGASFTEFDHGFDDPTIGLAGTGSVSKTGYTVGGGVNYALTDKLILGLDYRYTGYGRFDYVGVTAFGSLTATQNPTLHTVRASLAYKF